MTVKQLFDICLEKTDSNTASLIFEYEGFSKTDLILNAKREIPEEQCNSVLTSLDKNIQGEPLAYIYKKRAFYKDIFYVTKGVLIPQPDTETLVEEGIAFLRESTKQTVNILDLCSGSGCVGISIAKEVSKSFENVNLYLSDISGLAYDCTKQNVQNLIKEDNVSVFVYKADLFEKVKALRFDLIVSNPPYIATDIIKTLDKEVQAEPVLALDGGKSGLDILEKIAFSAKDYLSSSAALMVEIGYDQGSAVKELFEKNSFTETAVIKDLSGNDRVVKGFIK